MMRYGANGSGWMWVFGGLLTLGILVLIGVAIWAVITVTNRTRHRPPAPDGPVDPEAGGRARTRQLLDERYARGEMSTEEYTERRHTLGL